MAAARAASRCRPPRALTLWAHCVTRFLFACPCCQPLTRFRAGCGEWVGAPQVGWGEPAFIPDERAHGPDSPAVAGSSAASLLGGPPHRPGRVFPVLLPAVGLLAAL